MANLTDILKKAAVGFGVIALSYVPLNAQKSSNNYFKNINMSHCLSKSGRSYSHPSKNEKVEIYCISKKAKKDNYTANITESPYKNYCVSKQEKRYNRHFNKEMRRD